jgi:pseudolysin/vibriolysin
MTRNVKLALVGSTAVLLNCSSSPTPSPNGGGLDLGNAPLPASEAPKANAVRLTTQGAALAGADPVVEAVRFSRDRSAELRLATKSDFVLRQVEIGGQIGAMGHVRLQQTHQGLKVWGGDVVVHVSDDGSRTMNGNVVSNLPELETKPAVDADAAMAIAKGLKANGKTIATTREASELVVYNDKAGAHVAWHTTFFTELQANIGPGLWNAMIDAATGKVLKAWNGIHTAQATDEASGPGGNPRFNHPWNSELDVTKSGANYQMDTDRLQTLDLKTAESGGSVVTATSLTGFADAPDNDAHGYAEKTLNMLRDWQGFSSIDGKGFKILSRVHYGVKYENAFWDGTQMTYGDGDTLFYPLSGSIDVCAHEIDHGFTSNHSNLTYSGMSGGMNESFSDIAGKTAQWYDTPDQGDFDLGANVFKQAGQALRYMCDPTKDGSSIDSADNYNDSLDVHYSSGVMNKAFCLAAKRFSSGDPQGKATADGVKRASQAWYHANAKYWTASSDFTQGCQGVYDAAKELKYTDAELGYIRDSWKDVAVYCGGAAAPPPKCDETFTTATGSVTSPNYPSNYPDSSKKTFCIAPTGGGTVTLKFDDFETEDGYDFVDVLGANAEQLSHTSGTTKPADASAAKLYVKFTSDSSVDKKGFKASWTTQ